MTLAIGLALLAAAALFAARSSGGTDREAWEEYENDTERTFVERAFAPLSQRFASGPLVAGALKSPDAFESLERDIRLGNSFGRSLEVYLSVQLSALIAGSFLLLLALGQGASSQQSTILLATGGIVAYLPYYRVQSQATKKEEEMLRHLPRFADLMVMVLGTLSVPQAISYAASKDSGPVADEMSSLVSMLSSRAMDDREAFKRAADRLGTTYGKDFVNTLAAAYIDGTASVDSIRKQTAGLRTLQFQSRRAYTKRMPVRMVGVFALHFLPLLLILAFIPVFFSLSGI